MWDFSIGRTLGIVIRTWPFVILRIVVYFSITVAYIVSTGAGAGIGYGVGHVWGEDGPFTFAMWGGIFGFGLVSVLFYWLREYILYLVKAGHIAVMVRSDRRARRTGRPRSDQPCPGDRARAFRRGQRALRA